MTELEIRKQFYKDFPLFARFCLNIRTKNGTIERLGLNKAQYYIHEIIEKQRKEKGHVRVIILKGRQQGCSTYVEARFYWRVIHREGLRAFILTHEQKATDNLYKMARRFHDLMPPELRPPLAVSNSKEMNFDLIDSGYKIGTAGSRGVGRSDTIQLFHGSEVALWENASEHAAGIMQAIPYGNDTEVILESTAKGMGNFYHEQWQLAEKDESDFIPIFVPWFWQTEYAISLDGKFIITSEEQELRNFYGLSNEQLNWRRIKIRELGEDLFHQEYPCCAVEAFQRTSSKSFIFPELVMAARKTDKCEAYGALIIGVDPAREGEDRTSIIKRRGRVAYDLNSYKKLDNMSVVGLILKIIKEDKPDKIFIDIGGGAGIVDRLRELGYGPLIRPINFGSKALGFNIYANKRAEMWGEMKKWLEDGPVKIPDSDSLHADLCAPSVTYDSNSRLLLEKKELLKRSPDEGDALALTFAEPVGKINSVDVSRYMNRTINI